MATEKISDMTTGTSPLTGDELFEMVQGGNTRNTSGDEISKLGVEILAYTSPLTNVVDTIFPIIGTFRTVDTGETGDVATDWPVSNQHIWILVNSITTGGDIVITGTSLSEGTAVPTAADTETITVDTSTGQYYQSSKKWWEITNIDITTGTIVSIDYDYGIVGYPDAGNRDFKILGYRIDAYAQSDIADFSLVMNKVQDDGGKKMSIVPLEDYGVDSGNAGDQLIDNLRTGLDDRSYNPAVGNIWENNTNLTFKQLDFDTYFTSDENIFESPSFFTADSYAQHVIYQP